METCSQKYKSTAKIDNSKKFPWIKCEQCGVYVSERSIAYHKKYCERKSPEVEFTYGVVLTHIVESKISRFTKTEWLSLSKSYS